MSVVRVATAPACFLCGGPLRQRYSFGAISLACCRACQLGQLTPLPTEADLAALYGSRRYFEGTDRVGYADYAGDVPQFTRTFRGKLDQLLRFGPVDDLLEVGCGPGYFLREARDWGIRRVVGIDRNPWAVEEAHRQGLEAYVGSVDTLPPGWVFDAVVMLDVLEHITHPLTFLEHIRQRLRPGGRLFIMTPNIRSVLAIVSGRRWVSFKIPEHVYYYSPRSIRRLLDRCDFEAVACSGTGQWVTVAFLLDRLRRLVPHLAAALDAAARALKLQGSAVFVTNGSIDVIARAR